jgi:preprotein translocase subunit YajC
MFNDPFTLAMLAVLAVLIFFMFRNSRKRKAETEKLQSQIVPGAEVMTNFGLFGTLLSIDEVSNVAEIETSPGNVLRVHRQTITRVVSTDDAIEGGEPRSVEEAMARATAEQEARDAAEKAAETAPEFGERTTEAGAVILNGEPVVEKKPRAPRAKKAAE